MGSGALLAALFVVSCSTGRIDLYTCSDPCLTCERPCEGCNGGTCVPVPALGWQGPVLLWTGTADAVAPACPEQAPAMVYEGHDGFRHTGGCPPCLCTGAACQVPSTVVVREDAACTGEEPGPDDHALALPQGWNGACAPATSIPGATGSLVTTSTSVGACTPQVGPVPASGPFAWAFFARACTRVGEAVACEDGGQQCAPEAEGFRHCVFKDRDEPVCPAGYPERRVFFGDVDGELGCTACTCGPPEGGVCDARLTAFSDEACTDELANASASLTEVACAENVAPDALGGIAVTWEVETEGTCEPGGGQPTGKITPALPSTFCCAP
ncbi:hypothetical protein [Chondromyces apiculatus]|uniref:Uncharacterized protein n=1 Tax=Chondromyces apiculatus DSM 436 TaxID=1192034 RepID=A0A017TDR4_9BACT|nr:hypothetical protein [Chondromyces apiculatus]EYF07438.1 Hypothetical protein CAP_0191 [Chondromyces apiculatus DSM 436]